MRIFFLTLLLTATSSLYGVQTVTDSFMVELRNKTDQSVCVINVQDFADWIKAGEALASHTTRNILVRPNTTLLIECDGIVYRIRIGVKEKHPAQIIFSYHHRSSHGIKVKAKNCKAEITATINR